VASTIHPARIGLLKCPSTFEVNTNTPPVSRAHLQQFRTARRRSDKGQPVTVKRPGQMRSFLNHAGLAI
jgi:hypothetical protein